MIGPGVGPSFYSGVPLPFPGATFGSDFTTNQYQLSGAVYGVPSSLPGFTFTRASTGYAQTVAGTLTSFASGAPRITDRGMLIEEARTNLLLRSQEFDNASWVKTRCTVTADAAVAPDGTTTADAFVEDATAGSNHRVVQAMSKAASAITYTQSCYLKASARNFAVLYSEGAAGTARTYFNIANGTISTAAAVTGTWTSPSATITALANGWYRCTQTWTTDTGTYADQYIFGSADGSTLNYNGVNGQVGFYMWGAQTEVGAFATSYIPTTTASATRAADVAALGSLSLLTGYSLYGEWFGEALPTSARVLDISGSVLIRRAGSSVSFNGAGRERSRTGGSGLCKAASAIGASDIEAALNGVTAGAASGTFSAVTVTTLTFASTGSSSYLNGYLRKVIIYPTALSLADLVTLTT